MTLFYKQHFHSAVTSCYSHHAITKGGRLTCEDLFPFACVKYFANRDLFLVELSSHNVLQRDIPIPQTLLIGFQSIYIVETEFYSLCYIILLCELCLQEYRFLLYICCFYLQKPLQYSWFLLHLFYLGQGKGWASAGVTQ